MNFDSDHLMQHIYIAIVLEFYIKKDSVELTLL